MNAIGKPDQCERSTFDMVEQSGSNVEIVFNDLGLEYTVLREKYLIKI